MLNNFYVRKITPEFSSKVMEKVGFDKCYISKAILKYDFNLIKVDNLTSPQANIIKQLALSIGADAAVHRDVITCKIDKSNIMIGCTSAQLMLISEKLKKQSFKLSELSDMLLYQLSNKPTPLKIRNKIFNWSEKTFIMGILNITPDSFSDGGKYFDEKSSKTQILKMLNAKVDIIDIGGESTKPYSSPVSADEQLSRILLVINQIRELDNQIPISIDTRSSIVAKEAINCGADMINDVSGFDFDEEMCSTAASLNVPVILMHSKGTPETMQDNPEYEENITDAVYMSLLAKVQYAASKGISKQNIIIDPGIGFGKTQEHNLELIKRAEEFKSIGVALLVGVSRKSVISNVLNVSPLQRDDATLALNSYLATKGVNILRVHNVESHTLAFKVLDNIIR